jgi:hypothetical protein
MEGINRNEAYAGQKRKFFAAKSTSATYQRTKPLAR